MVGPTWTRVCLTLGSDYLPALFQGTASPLLLAPCLLHCLLAHVRCQMIQGCTSMLLPSLSICICGPGGYTCKGVHSLKPDLGRLWSVADLLQLRPGFLQRCGFNKMRRRNRTSCRMNLVVIEEHQVRDLVFAQAYYLYIRLKATSAYVIVPIAKVPRTKYSSYQ